MKLPDFEAWAIFASVVEHRSFSGAAEALQVSKATVSKAITRLETRLGTSLFHRTSRRLTLTDSGLALSEHAHRIRAEGEAAEEAAFETSTAPVGLIKVAAPLTFGIQAVAPVIADFLRLYPGIRIDLRLSDAFVDIVGEGIDIALRIAELPDSSLRARRLGPVTGYLIASPDYFAAKGVPQHPADLAHHACLIYTNVSNPELWRFRKAGGEEAAVRVEGPIRTDSGDAMLPALRAGLGIARLPEFLIADELSKGTLVPILQEWTSTAAALHLMTPPGRLRPARVETLLDFLEQRLRPVCSAA